MRSRLLGLLVLAGLLPLVAATVVELRSASALMERRGHELLAANADHLADQLDAFHGAYAGMARRTAQVPAVARLAAGEGPAREVEAYFEAVVASDHALRGLALFDLRGRITHGSEPSLLGNAYAFRRYFRQAVAGTSAVADIYLAVPEVSSVPSIAYAEPVRGRDGRVVGVLTVFVRASAFWNLVEVASRRAGRGGYAIITDRHGVRIADTLHPDRVFRPSRPLSPDAIEELVVERRFGDETRRLLEQPIQGAATLFSSPVGPDELLRHREVGREDLGVARQLTRAPWSVGFFVPEAVLLEPARRLVRETVAAAGAILLVTLLGGWFAAGWFVRPLKERTAELAGAREELERRNADLLAKNGQLEEHHRRDAVYAGALAALVAEPELRRALDQAMQLVGERLGLPLAAVCRLVEADPPRLTPLGGRGATETDLPLMGSAQEALRARRTLVLDPLPAGAELRWDAAVAHGRLVSAALVPLRAGERALGAVVLGAHRSLSAEAVSLVEELALPIGLRIERAELEEETSRAREALEAKNSELVAQSERLRKRNRELDLFFGVSPDLFAVADREGRFARLNPSWSRVLGWSLEDLVGRAFLDLVHPEDRARTQAEFQRILTGSELTGFENRYLDHQGGVRWLRWSASPVPDEGLVFASARDVTAERSVEEKLREQAHELIVQGEELRAQQTALEQKNQELELASRFKSEFLANMSHELRTPLNAVIGFSELLLSDREQPLHPEHRRRVEDVRLSGRHLLGLINDILDLVKVEAGRVTLHLEPVPPYEALEDARSMIAGAAEEKGISVRLESRATRPVLADRARLRQILINLTANAIKFSPRQAGVELLAEDDGTSVRFSVVDHGPGIDPALRARLFQPFVQGESPLVKSTQGTGLGLAISRRLVEAHGGEISVDSQPGQGATFAFTIPVCSPDQPPVERTTDPVLAPAALGGGWRRSDRVRVATTPVAHPVPEPVRRAGRPLVLVVEVDPAAARLLEAWLQAAGYDVRSVGDAGGALSLALQLRPAAMLLDVELAGSNGLDLLAELRRRPETRDLPVIMTSVSDDRTRGLALGAADWFVKPLEREALLARLAQLAPAEPRERPLVLVIDDDPRVAGILRGSLEPAGYEVTATLTGAEGVARARAEDARRPDLVVVDISLPDLSGFEVVEALAHHAATAGLPILVLTAGDLAEAERERLRKHVRAVAIKGDVDQEALLATVQSLLRPGDAAPARTAQGPTILVVDDHDLNRELVRTILAARGYRIVEAPDGKSAVELAAVEAPGLVLMDLAMPRMDGFAALAALRSDPATRHIPVVALTALAMRSDERRVREAGFDGYLTKPIDRAALEEAAEAFLPL